MIWRAAFESEQANQHRASVNRLISVFDQVRENTKVLVSEISVDLPGYTVHDIDHIDALWEIASQIVGDNFQINPVEGFVLGCSFLFHDSAMTMSAYPGGIKEARDSREWKLIRNRLLSMGNSDIDDAMIVETFLREQHALRAEKLPKISWKADIGTRFLIDDADSREKFGDFIGQLAASHWWDHSKVDGELQDKLIPAPAPFPSSWSIDLLKLACVIRTADAAQIDERRAPGLLRALRRNRLSDYSSKHWNFQSKLTQAQNRNDTLYFASLRPFTKGEAKEWWMLHDTLKMIDGELRKTDDLLARRRGNSARFAARRVANIESTDNLKSCIKTEGWQPVDTAFSISDIPKLIANLGGSQLYGQDCVAPLREVIQNAMDSTRLRQVIDPQSPEPLVEVEIKSEKGNRVLIIRDNGVGMSECSIVENLLSFGRSGWLNDAAIGEYNDEFPSSDSVSGRYGIGFFSIFMIGDAVNIKSRRFDASPDQTVILTFPEGLNTRPLLCGAEYTERMTAGGTEISVTLDTTRLEEQSWRSELAPPFWRESLNGPCELNEAISRSFPTSDVPVKVKNGNSINIIDGRNWESEPASALLRRIEGSSYPGELGIPYESALSLIIDGTGTTVGRAVLFPDSLERFHRKEAEISGAVVSQGARLCSGKYRGILLGRPLRAARDYAVPVASKDAMRRWASEQAQLLRPILSKDEDQENIAAQVSSIGGNVGELKFCEIGGIYLNREELRNILSEKSGIWVAFNAEISNNQPRGKPSVRTDNCISVDCGTRGLIPSPIWAHSLSHFEGCTDLRQIALEVICEQFEIEEEVIAKMYTVENGSYVHGAATPAWLCDDGTICHVSGHYFTRNMTLKDVDYFFVQESERL